MSLVMPINALDVTEERTIEFKGLNRKEYVQDGEMSDMLNLTSDRYPLLCPRKLRGEHALPEGAVKPLSIVTRYGKIAMIAEKSDSSIAFFFGDDEVTALSGLLSEETYMVPINTKICFFPEQIYLTVPPTGEIPDSPEWGHLGASFSGHGLVSISGSAFIRYMYTPSVSLKADDAVNLTGTISYTDSGGVVHSDEALEISFVIESVTSAGNVTTIGLPAETFIEMIGEGATGITVNGTMSREIPEDLSCVIEWNNRLWGVSDKDNTVYACKLGDPTNWTYYQGTSLDSYYAQQGTDEVWTGSAAYSAHLIFFKQNSMCKIYGTSPSSYQVVNAKVFGCEEGSSKSIVVLNDVVFYKSTLGIMAYEGGTPYSIGEKLNTKFKNVVSGTDGIKYYASVELEDGSHEVFVLDVEKALWHKEDNKTFRDTCTLDGRMYFIDADDDKVYVTNPETPTESRLMKWSAVFGPFDEYVEDRKIYSRLSLRFLAKPKAIVKVFIKMDQGEWETVGEYAYTETGGETIPIVPRRCDRYSIRIDGMGECEIKSLTRRVRRGTRGKL